MTTFAASLILIIAQTHGARAAPEARVPEAQTARTAPTARTPQVARGARTAEESFFGLNAISFFHYRDAPDAAATANARMRRLDEARARWDRFDFWWGEIEPTKGQWKWDKADWLVDFYARHQIAMLPILCYRANWMDHPPRTDEDFAQFANYTEQVVKRYRGRVKYWEVWNEPNIPTFWKPPNTRDYARLLKAAYTAAKKADPNCVIVGASANETDVNFLLDIGKYGAADAMDAVSFHPYSMADGPEEMHFARQIQNVRAAMAKIGRGDIPIWITEMGWQADAAKSDEVAAQCRYMVQSHVIALSQGVARMFWFNLQDWREGEKVEGWGLTDPQGKAKASLGAYRVMVDALEGAEFAGFLPVDHGVACVFERKGRALIVAWANRGHSARLDLKGMGARSVVELNGQPRAKQPGTPIIELGNDPVYVQFTSNARFGDLAKSIPEPGNLVVNGEFETQDHGQIYAWNKGVFYGGEDKGTFAASDEGVNGGRCALLEKTTSALWQSYPVPAMPGEKYRLTAKMKTRNAGGENQVQILFLSGPGWGWKGGPASESMTGTHDWQTVSVSGTVPADADVVRVNLVSKNNPGTVSFDDVELTREP